MKASAIAVVFLATLLLSAFGLLLSTTQLHGRDWKGDVALVLLLPYALLNRLLRSMLGTERLSQTTYYVSLVLGFLGQFVYYAAIFRLFGIISTTRTVRAVRSVSSTSKIKF